MPLSGQRTVSFISNLIPLYTFDQVNGVHCARSLSDGTLILPKKCDESIDHETEEWVTVWWQGDRERASDVLAGLLASKLIVDFVQLQSTGKSPGFSRRLLEHLAQHYEHKTGQSLFLYPDDESALTQAIERVRQYWPDVVWDVLKGQILPV